MIRTTSIKGFSLMELVIALAVIAILAALAFPSFSDQLQRGRRMDAITTLLDLQIAQEAWRANNNNYADLEQLGWTTDASAEGYYRIRIAQRSAAGFLATAEPLAGGPQRDDRCGTFALDQRGPVISADYADDICWRH